MGDEPELRHGVLLVPVGTTGGWLGTVMSGNGLMPPVASSVDPMGMPTRPTVDRVPRAGEEADALGLEDAVVVPLAQVPEAVPDTPILSNRGVGAIVAPVMTVLAPAIEVPVLEFPGLEEDGWTDAPIPEHVEAVVIEPRADVPAAAGLTPGVDSSVAPSGTPVAPTGAPGPMPSGEVTPSEAGAPVIVPTCAIAGLPHSESQATAMIKEAFMVYSPI